MTFRARDTLTNIAASVLGDAILMKHTGRRQLVYVRSELYREAGTKRSVRNVPLKLHRHHAQTLKRRRVPRRKHLRRTLTPTTESGSGPSQKDLLHAIHPKAESSDPQIHRAHVPFHRIDSVGVSVGLFFGSLGGISFYNNFKDDLIVPSSAQIVPYGIRIAIRKE